MKKLIYTDRTQFWQSVEVLWSKYDNILLKIWKKIANKYFLKKKFLKKFIWTQGCFFEKHAKKQKLCWMFEKIYLLQKFSEKHVSPQIVRLETLTPLLITLLTIFDQKTVFSTELKKNLSPTPPPVLTNLSKLNIFPGKNFFSEKFIWTDKDTTLTICFQSSKNISRKSRRSLEDIDSTNKDRSYKNPPDL